MEDIRKNPDVKGKELNQILFQRYGLYMKQSTLYKMKQYVINEIFGGHDKSYRKLPAYVKVMHETNPESAAFCALTDIGHPQRSLQFSSIFISFAAQIKGFVDGCRSLIGVDGTHLKGNYGGILLSAIALDGNNEIFPIAYAIVSVEDTQKWSFFFWHLYNLVKDSGRTDWTIISDRQKGVDIALKDVWPSANRRYCCRHLSRNFKRVFPVPLMYILFWRAANATNPYTFKKAMERLRKEGKTPVMKWFAEIGKQNKWTKHKFDSSICCDSNTSNLLWRVSTRHWVWTGAYMF
ncbi:uncharacterized protein LOC104893709 [Beta vulgaris subsp. vulgaris]|uniref:uncharacterized protein LOC104893709 n=1 Tax=Beta vulgaris subsp. vulgaris TaxID=3555 RepID=UPI00053F2D7B|nr:uncharacterized protein LOC104893709 [Beta vulgaris subsp. vulgaris]